MDFLKFVIVNKQEKLKGARPKLELHITFHQRSSQEVTINSVIYGLLVVFYTFFYADTHPFMEKTIKRFSKLSKKVNTILMVKNGRMYQKKPKI